jgi:hypothetical protein
MRTYKDAKAMAKSIRDSLAAEAFYSRTASALRSLRSNLVSPTGTLSRQR